VSTGKKLLSMQKVLDFTLVTKQVMNPKCPRVDHRTWCIFKAMAESQRGGTKNLCTEKCKCRTNADTFMNII
jgi:hypothetical protein